MSKQITYFPGNTFNTDKVKYVSVERILRNILMGAFMDIIVALRRFEYDSPEYKHFKRTNIPYVIFSGTFTHRNNRAIDTYSQIVVCDYDLKENPGRNSLEVRKAIEGDKHTLAAFDSPSGLGFKFLVRTDNLEPHCHREAALQIYRYYEVKYFDMALDDKQATLSQPCFVSYDPNLYYNEFAVPFKFNQEHRRTTQSRPPIRRQTVEEIDVMNVFEFIENIVLAGKIAFYDGNKHNYFFNLACVANRFGVPKEETEAYIRSAYPGVRITTNCIDYPYQVFKGEFGIKEFFGFNRKGA